MQRKPFIETLLIHKLDTWDDTEYVLFTQSLMEALENLNSIL